MTGACPEPWTIEKHGEAWFNITDSFGSSVAEAIPDAKAAQVMVAAPDMREAIWQALDDMADSHCVCEDTKQMLRDALTKADAQNKQ